MRTKLLLFVFAQVVKETIVVWFMFTNGVFDMPRGYEIAVSVGAAFAIAALVLTAIKISSVAHTDPDTAWVAWVRFIIWSLLCTVSVALIILEPRAGSPMLALIIVAGRVAVAERRRDRAAVTTELQGLPTVTRWHQRKVAAALPTIPDERGPLVRPLGAQQTPLADENPKRGGRVGKALNAVDISNTLPLG